MDFSSLNDRQLAAYPWYPAQSKAVKGTSFPTLQVLHFSLVSILPVQIGIVFRSCYTQNTSLKIFIFERPTCPLSSMWWWKRKEGKQHGSCAVEGAELEKWRGEKQADVSGLSSHLRSHDVLSCADTKGTTGSVLMSRANITTKSHVDVRELGCQLTPC